MRGRQLALHENKNVKKMKREKKGKKKKEVSCVCQLEESKREMEAPASHLLYSATLSRSLACQSPRIWMTSLGLSLLLSRDMEYATSQSGPSQFLSLMPPSLVPSFLQNPSLD